MAVRLNAPGAIYLRKPSARKSARGRIQGEQVCEVLDAPPEPSVRSIGNSVCQMVAISGTGTLWRAVNSRLSAFRWLVVPVFVVASISGPGQEMPAVATNWYGASGA